MAIAARLRVRFNRVLSSVGFPRDFFLIPLAAAVGCIGGLVATGFDWLVEAAGEFFYRPLGHAYHTFGDYLLLMLLPALGGVIVGIIQQFIARSRPSHGIPEVVESIARHHGEMPGRMGIYKTITASLTIGSGGSAGVEGPIIQIGSVMGSVIARFLHVGREHIHTLIGCGAASTLAGIFNAPIAGVLFVLEVLLRDFSIKTFMPIVVASVFGTAVAQAILGQNVAVFTVPEAMRISQVILPELWAYAVLGVICGLFGVAFAASLHWSEELFGKMPLPRFIRPAVGGAMLGVLGIVFLFAFGRPVHNYEPPPFYANGYTVIEATLNPLSYATEASDAPPVVSESHLGPHVATHTEPVLEPTSEGDAHTAVKLATLTLLTMLVFKFIGTCLTLGSGGSGGIFAPSLFMGAALGGGFAMVLMDLNIFPGVSPATYALAGMAGFLAATVHCPLTAFLLVFEITQDYKIILPVMLVAILATTISQIACRDSIYTRWLRARGIHVGNFSDLTLLRRLDVSSVPLAPPVVVHPEDPAQKLIELAEEYAAVDYVVCDENEEYVGMVVGEDVRTTLVQREAIPLMIVGELMRTDLPTVTRDETLDVVLDKFSRHEVSSLAVVDDNQKARGVITRSRLMRQYQRALQES